MRHVSKEATWDEAKEGCESEGDMLAVFPSMESVIWMDQLLKGPDDGNERSHYLPKGQLQSKHTGRERDG